ncbi:MAG: homoserine O-acetyltransferase [Phenylobacterium sp.]|jgi:homoserine O-acetyltransferase
MQIIKPIIFSMLLVLVLLVCSTGDTFANTIPELNTVNIGDYKTTSRAQIRRCIIGYRTFGSLNADKSNVVLWPTWFGGTSEDLFTANTLVNSMDTKGLYVIVVDALANGVSSSPSNTRHFPDITIRDMVNTQHELLVKHLGIHHLKAVIGISMGGMQAHEWSVAYPTFMDKVIAIVGSPKQSAFDILVWQTQVDLITNAGTDKQQQDFALKKAHDIFYMHATTPTDFAQRVDPDKLQQYMAQKYQNMKNGMDYMISAKAMIKHDIYKSAGVLPSNIQRLIKADLLMIISDQDHLVNPLSSIALAKTLKRKVVILKGNNGHTAPFIQTAEVFAATSAFLKL